MVNKSPLRVLVVEDEPLMRWSLAETLSAAGHTVVEVDDGASALRLLGDTQPVDVVLLDFRLPDTIDLRLLADIRARVPRTPVVMMTAYGNPALTTDARKLGAYDVLEKPFDIYSVERVLEDAYDASHPPPQA